MFHLLTPWIYLRRQSLGELFVWGRFHFTAEMLPKLAVVATLTAVATFVVAAGPLMAAVSVGAARPLLAATFVDATQPLMVATFVVVAQTEMGGWSHNLHGCGPTLRLVSAAFKVASSRLRGWGEVIHWRLTHHRGQPSLLASPLRLRRLGFANPSNYKIPLKKKWLDRSEWTDSVRVSWLRLINPI